MAVYSMTGYASAQHGAASQSTATESAAPPTRRLGLEIRSVNSRFLDLSFRLPDELRALEPALRALVTRQIKRGKVEVRAAIENLDSGALPDPSPRLLQRLDALQETVRAWLPLAAPLSVAEVLRLGSSHGAAQDDWSAAVPALAEEALTALLAAREREGKRLSAMQLDRVKQLRALAEQAQPLVPQAVQRQQERFVQKYTEALQAVGGSVTPEAAQERALQETVRSWLPAAAPLTVAEVLRLGSTHTGTQDDWAAIAPGLAEEALQALLAARKQEGTRLATMLQERVQQLRTLTQQAVPLVPKLVEQQRQRFMERWKEAMGLAEGSVAPEAARDRALSEATAFAIRIDVAEEVTRLQSHLDEIERLLKKGGEVGKRLDFLIQELHREANTLGSKSAALELTRISVDMKVLIEQMREQVQNIE